MRFINGFHGACIRILSSPFWRTKKRSVCSETVCELQVKEIDTRQKDYCTVASQSHGYPLEVVGPAHLKPSMGMCHM